MSALACNIYITGLNQWSDLEVDKINKPWLPIAAGVLSRQNALRIVLVSGIVCLTAALCLSWAFFGLILSITTIGTAYSLPPLKLKRNHILAAAAISVVRGILVNIGFYLHFQYEITGTWMFAPAILPLAIFVTGFSLGIAWFKDIPDTKGDAVFHFDTLAVKNGRKYAFILGAMVVAFAYAYIIFAAIIGQLPSTSYYIITHGAALSLFLWQVSILRVADDTQVKRFYLFFWGLFFLEYMIYPVGFYLPS